MEGFIYLHRKMLDWEWYDDVNTCRVFLHCLFRANWKACKWHGIEIEPGQFITSLQTLSVETSLSVMQVRTALSHLISTGELTSKQQGKIRIITVNNWDRYQDVNKQNIKEITRRQQDDNKMITTDEERNKEIKKLNNSSRAFTPPTVEEVRAYVNEKGLNVDPDRFVDFYESKGWMVGKNKMKSWEAAARNWSAKDKKPKNKFDNFQGRSYDFNELERMMK